MTALQTQNDPAAIAVAPGRGSINPQKDTKMNEVTNSTPVREIKVCDAADDVNRAKAIVLVVWILKWMWGSNGSKPDEGTTSTPPATGPVSDM